MRIALAADHNGIALKARLAGWLGERGHAVTDAGAHDAGTVVDYPPLCAAVSAMVARGTADLAIVVGGSGQGEVVACNKIRGVRAGLAYSRFAVEISRGNNETRVCKTVLVVGMLFGLAVFGATQTVDPVWAIMWISIALGGLAAAAPVGWSLPSLIAPRGGVGTVGGIMNFINNLMGVVAPIVTGVIVGATNSFTNAFAVAGVVLVVGIVSFVFVMGPIEAIPDRD